jgi:subtilisin family serine protease
MHRPSTLLSGLLIIFISTISYPQIIDGKNAGLVLQRVPEVWAEGYFGQGVLVASIDEDFNWDHPDIVNQIWNNLAEDADGDGHTIELNGNSWIYDPGDLNGIDDDGNGYVDDLIGWDFVENDNNVSRGSAVSHGTQVAGVLVGDGTNGIQTGIAPQAELMLLRIGTNSEQEQYYAWDAMQYCIDKGVDIISQSQSFHWHLTWCNENGDNCGPPDVAKFRELAELELAAGIIHFSSISNNGNKNKLRRYPVPFNVSVPGNCPPPWLHSDQSLQGGVSAIMGVGNVSTYSPNTIHNSSPHGPSSQEDYTWYWSDARPMPLEYQDYPYNGGSMGLLKPDITAYGAGTETTNGVYPNFEYSGFSGTSSATPHAAGVAALLLSVDPTLTPSDVCRIMKLSSIDNGDPGHDNRYGAGTVDAFAAYNMVLGTPPPPPPVDSSKVILTYFTATLNGSGVLLEWETTKEIDNLGWDVERSFKNNSNYQVIGFVPGTNDPSAYSFSDQLSSYGKYFYRLKQIDFDQTTEYSDEVSVNYKKPRGGGPNSLVSFPTPFNPQTTIAVNIDRKQDVKIDVYNMLGQHIVTLFDGKAEAGKMQFTFNGQSLSSGTYVVVMQTELSIINHKILLLK